MTPVDHENRHRHADKVVEVSRRGQRFSEKRTHGGGAKLLGAGLADGAADRDGGKRAGTADTPQMMPGKVTEGGQRIVNLDCGESLAGGGAAAARDDRGYGAAARRFAEVRMSVAIGALESNEERASLERSRIARDSAYNRIRRAEQLAAGCGGDLVETEGALVDWYRRCHRRRPRGSRRMIQKRT